MRRALPAAAFAAAVLLSSVGDAAPASLHSLGETAGHAAGVPSNVVYGAIENPTVAADGDILFEAQLGGATTATGVHDSGVFLGKQGSLALVARAGDTAPGTGGLAWSRLMAIGQVGRTGKLIAFAGEILGADSAHDGGIWAGVPGSFALVAREGDPAPGTSLVYGSATNYFQGNLHLAMNDSGAVALRATLSGTGVTVSNDQAVFAGMPGALSLVARLGDVAPGAGASTFAANDIKTETFSAPSIDAAGRVLFRSHLTGGGVLYPAADAIWFGDPGSLAIVVRGGQPVTGPGIPPGSTLVNLGSYRPVLNDADQILFESQYEDGVNRLNAVWLGPMNAPVAIAVDGRPAPGDPMGATFGGTFFHLRLNGAGHAEFEAELSTSASDSGLFVWDGAVLHEIARTGDDAPGMVGEKFGSLISEDVFLNAGGKLLFRETTQPSGFHGVWVADPATGSVQLVARDGAAMAVDGKSKTITDILLFSGPDTAGSTQDGRSAPFGDDGTVVMLAKYSDGHSAVLTGSGGGGSATATPSTVSLGAALDVTGSGFGGGASKFKAPTAWITVGSDPHKITVKVAPKTASDADFAATVTSLRKGLSGPATLHVQPKAKGATEIDASLTVELPSIASVSAASGVAGDAVTITGSFFGTKKRKVVFLETVNGKAVAKSMKVTAWADGSISIVVGKRLVPKGATTIDGEIEIENDPGASNAVAFTVTD
jgi:hypothetical protein